MIQHSAPPPPPSPSLFHNVNLSKMVCPDAEIGSLVLSDSDGWHGKSHGRTDDLEAPESAKNSIFTPSTSMGYLGIFLNASLLYIIKNLSEFCIIQIRITQKNASLVFISECVWLVHFHFSIFCSPWTHPPCSPSSSPQSAYI